MCDGLRHLYHAPFLVVVGVGTKAGEGGFLEFVGGRMGEVMVTPHAPSFIESMRAVGYSLESAIADIVDNSISADARQVRIEFRPFDEPYVAILDDGRGMTSDELTQAMRHGGRNPLEERSPFDLGRFGLGLKTASLSQCRKLTVVTLMNGILSALCWDLDLVVKREDWVLWRPDNDEEVKSLPHVKDLLHQGKGTVVIWQDLDRLAAGELSVSNALGFKMDRVRDHLSQVFHRYLAGEAGLHKLNILVNNVPVQTIDPFLSSHKGTQKLYEDTFTVDGQTIRVQPYILPHITKLSPEELRLAGGEEGLRRNQGFYVYRNKRLIIRGTWFRLARAEELTKLARVIVDIPNSLDHLWTLDIKKSAAYPPEVVRRNLARTVQKISERSRKTYTFRGRVTKNDGLVHAWSRIEGRVGVSYCINRNHPVVKTLEGSMDDDQRQLFLSFLNIMETTYPADALYADIASDRTREIEPLNMKALKNLASQILDSIPLPDDRSALLNSLNLIEPFSSYPEVSEKIIKEMRNAQ